MAKTITQKVTFKDTTIAKLYSMFLDPKQHAAMTGNSGKCSISAKEGGKYSVMDSYITGRNLQLLKNKLIVQSWRSVDFTKDDMDSTFIMLFEQKGKDAIINMTHTNIPDKEVDGIKKGWPQYYWTPMKAYLAAK
jgi:activator of HSP90 ATPase